MITLRTATTAHLLNETGSARTGMTVVKVLNASATDEKGAARLNMRGMEGEPAPPMTTTSHHDGTWTASAVVAIEIREHRRVSVTEMEREVEGMADIEVHVMTRYREGMEPDLNNIGTRHLIGEEGEHRISLQNSQTGLSMKS